MNTRPRQMILLAAAVSLTGFTAWLLWPVAARPALSPPPRAPIPLFAQTAAPTAAPAVAQAPVSSAARKRFEKIDDFRAEYRKMDFSAWLTSSGRDAAGLVALWDLSRDPAALEEAARRFPEDPLVAFAMLRLHQKNPEAALPWIEKLLAWEPDNPAVLYWKTALLKTSGDTAAAMAALKRATETKGAPDERMRGRVSTTREAVLASGGDAREASIAAILSGMAQGYDTFIGSGVLSLLNEQRKSAKGAGDAAAVDGIARLGIGLAEHLSLTNGRAMLQELQSNVILRSMLKDIDPETEYGTGGKTVGGRLAEMEREWTEIRELNIRTGAWTVWDLDAADASEYLNRYLFRGERDATIWALDKRR